MADIRALELEFAKTPTLDACIPLCEAYLASSRFMEAMVVCKKGIKAAPSDPRGPVMLARVYLEQGKVPKAQSELDAVAGKFPGNPVVLETQGRLAMVQGNTQGAVPFLQQALMGDPSRENARRWLQELGVAAPPPGAMAPQPGYGAPPMQPQPMQPPPMQPQQAMPMGMPQQAARPMMPQQGMQQPPPMRPAAMPPQMPSFPQQSFATADAAANAFGHGVGGQPAAPSPFGSAGGGGAPFGAADGNPAADKHLEHVSDFFSSDTLGFSNDTGGPETAGPGRLTIIGFVPKSTGSLRTTLIVGGAMLAVAAVVMTFVWIDSKNKRQINAIYSEVLQAMQQDKYVEYKNAIELGKKIYAVDSDHALTLATMAYAHAVLAVDHGVEDSMPKAKEELKKALEQPDEQNHWRYAAAALIAYSEGKIEDGITGIKDVADKSSNAIVQMEHLRLRLAQDPNAEMTKKALAKTTQTVSGDARVFNFLGWFYFKQENWTKADSSFVSATQNVRDHEEAILGSALTDLERGIGLKERQKEIEKNLTKVFGLPEEELSQPIKALAHFARGQLRNWQDKGDDAKKDYDEAAKINPKNSLFLYRRGVAETKLGVYTEAVEHLKTAVKMEPNDVQYLIKLAQAQIGASDTAGAEQTIKRGLELAKDHAELLLARGDMLREAKDYDEAIKAYEKLDLKTHSGPEFARAQIGISTVYREHDKAPLAVKHIEDFLAKAPASISKDPPMQAELWGELGKDYEAAGKDAKAEECYNVGVEQFRYYPENHYHLCRMKGWKGPEAKSFCALYITLAPRGKYAEEIKKKVPGIEIEAAKSPE